MENIILAGIFLIIGKLEMLSQILMNSPRVGSVIVYTACFGVAFLFLIKEWVL